MTLYYSKTEGLYCRDITVRCYTRIRLRGTCIGFLGIQVLQRHASQVLQGSNVLCDHIGRARSRPNSNCLTLINYLSGIFASRGKSNSSAEAMPFLPPWRTTGIAGKNTFVSRNQTGEPLAFRPE